MEVRLGYACINTQLGGFKSYCLADLYKDSKASEVKNRIIYNFKNTLDILKWNEEHNIKMYRFTSILIPLATHEEYWMWQERHSWYWFKDPTIISLMNKIKEYVTEHKHWVSLHPGQYTVLNSDKPEIVSKSIQDLKHHYYLLYHLGARGLVIHVGGVYGDKELSIKRWVENYKQLPDNIKPFIYLENDDKSYNVPDIIRISNMTGVTPLIDFHHWRCNPSDNLIEDVKTVIQRWGNDMKIHLSSGEGHIKDRKHAYFVTKEDFNWVVNILQQSNFKGILWMMLESKSKEQSVINLMKS